MECVPADSCELFTTERHKLTLLTPGSDERKMLLEKLQSLVCNKQEKKTCCDPLPKYIPSLEREECGLSSEPKFRERRAGRILGGDDTAIGEFPFLGLLGKEKRGSIQWSCGGSIINQWYVLSAASCGDNVDFVRLGEWKVVDPECENLDHCEREKRGREKECGGECEQANEKIDCETVEGVVTCTEPYQVPRLD